MKHSIIRRARNIGKAAIRLPRGFDLFHDLATVIDAHVVFDVGANIGQSARHYLGAFPNAEIYSFEPVAKTFDTLAGAFSGNRRFHPFRVAFGAACGTAMMDTAHGPSDMFQISKTGHEAVELTTLDEFTSSHDIAVIDFLKIDTEGHDLEVLKGAETMLRERRIAAVQVEAGMNAANKRHVPMEALKSHMEKRGYLLFGIYEQMNEWPTGDPWLRRSNLVFIPSV